MTNINESPVAYTIVVELKGTVPPESSLRVKKAQHLLTDGRLQACTSTGKISSNASWLFCTYKTFKPLLQPTSR